MTQRYLIAKFAPDVFRMEPKNIGVILWVDGSISSKFLDSHAATFIDDKSIYERWINYWNRLIRDRVIVNGTTISAEDPAFIDAMMKKQEGNFMLLDAGRVIDPIKPHDVQSAAEFLFNEMVAPLPEITSASESTDSLSQVADEIFEETGLRHRQDWRGPTSVKCQVKGIIQEFSFSYVFGTEQKTNAVFQRVPIGRKQSVNSAAFMMEWVGVRVVKAMTRRAAIIDTSDGDQPTKEQSIAMLGQFATIIDIANRTDAKKKILKAAGPMTNCSFVETGFFNGERPE